MKKKLSCSNFLKGKFTPAQQKVTNGVRNNILGELNQTETGWLFDYCLNDDRENVNLAATKALTLTAYPVEQIPGIQKNILEQGLLEYILHWAAEGHVRVHVHVEPSEFEVVELIGKGASASVYKALWKKPEEENKIEVAVKHFDVDHISFDMKEFRREVAFVCMLANEYIVPCLGANIDGRVSVFYLCS